MHIELSEKVIVITGSSKGLGAKLAMGFARENSCVVINYCRSESSALDLYNQISAFNDNCMLIQADITKPRDVAALHKQVMNKYGKVDVLVNNAGICDDNLIQMMTISQWNRVIETNLTGTFLCSRAFSKPMVQQRGGKIINIASLKGQIGCVGQANYAAAKAGVISLTQTMAKELCKFNISVNAICPGFVSTDLNIKNRAKIETAKKNSLMPIEYSTDDFLHSVLYLSSDAVNGITGRVFNLDSRL